MSSTDSSLVNDFHEQLSCLLVRIIKHPTKIIPALKSLPTTFGIEDQNSKKFTQTMKQQTDKTLAIPSTPQQIKKNASNRCAHRRKPISQSTFSRMRIRRQKRSEQTTTKTRV